MFKDYDSEEAACKTVEQMKQKYDESRIKVIVPFPKSNQTKTSSDYGLPEENVRYDGDEPKLEDTLDKCGFNIEQANILKGDIERGQVLVIICENKTS